MNQSLPGWTPRSSGVTLPARSMMRILATVSPKGTVVLGEEPGRQAAVASLDAVELRRADAPRSARWSREQPRALRRELIRILTVASHVDSCSVGKAL